MSNPAITASMTSDWPHWKTSFGGGDQHGGVCPGAQTTIGLLKGWAMTRSESKESLSGLVGLCAAKSATMVTMRPEAPAKFRFTGSETLSSVFQSTEKSSSQSTMLPGG